MSKRRRVDNFVAQSATDTAQAPLSASSPPSIRGIGASTCSPHPLIIRHCFDELQNSQISGDSGHHCCLGVATPIGAASSTGSDQAMKGSTAQPIVPISARRDRHTVCSRAGHPKRLSLLMRSRSRGVLMLGVLLRRMRRRQARRRQENSRCLRI